MKIEVSGAGMRRRWRNAMLVERDAWDRVLAITPHGDGTLLDAVDALDMAAPIWRDYERKARVKRLDPTIREVFVARLGVAGADLDAVFAQAMAIENLAIDDEPDGEGLVVGRWYKPGDTLVEDGVTYEVTRPFRYDDPGWRPENLQALLVAIPDTDEWTLGAAYEVGDKVTYDGVTYRCVQSHTSQEGWEPPAVPALWEPVET